MSYDAVIIGGGPAGTSAATALALQGRSVAIIERSRFPRRKVCGEFMSATNFELLDRLGVGDEVRRLAGPEIKRVGLFGAGPGIETRMPKGGRSGFGRALGRDVLDGLLLAAAERAGAKVFKEWRAVEIAESAVRITSGDDEQVLTAPVIVAAHGSWEPGKLPSHLPKRNRPSDLLGFKAHFTNSTLPADLMPLLVFPGGYGGMVWADNGRLSLSCCIRRDALSGLREVAVAPSAGAAVFRHILASCPGVADAVRDASLSGEWLAAGPIRPGMRDCYADDIFRVGNTAGESHPVIAEGISMAIQSGWLLGAELGRSASWDLPARQTAGARYTRAWRRQFATRIVVASAVAQLASRPLTADLMRRVVSVFPRALAWGARLSGKTKMVQTG